MGTRPRPNFFVVGAPKSGTTSLDHALRQHPDVFMPARKDQAFFGADLQWRFTYQYGRNRETLDQYLACFAEAGDQPRIGEVSVWYLFSKTAAHEIKKFAPKAQIVIMLRNPVDMMYAQHSQFLSNLNEDIEDFAAALDAESDRRDGRRIPRRAHFPQGLQYRDSARYADQVERYLDTFGRNRVHVIYYDDFRRDGALKLRGVLEFLGVDPQVPVNLEIKNPNKVVRRPALHTLAMSPPNKLEDAYHALTPSRFHGRLAGLARRLSLKYEPRPPMDLEIRRRLQQEFAPEVQRLSAMLQHDLSAWLLPPTDEPSP